METTLKELHCGSCRTVVSLQLADDDQVTTFLKGLIKLNPNAASSLQASMATITSGEPYRNKRKFRDVGDGIYEIKVPGIRPYCFKDQIDTLETKFILATNAGTKNNVREQHRDIKRAAQLGDRYFAAKQLPDAQLDYLQIDS